MLSNEYFIHSPQKNIEQRLGMISCGLHSKCIGNRFSKDVFFLMLNFHDVCPALSYCSKYLYYLEHEKNTMACTKDYCISVVTKYFL